MGKVIIFTGSPRKNGSTSKLLAQIAEGAKSKGAEIVMYDLNSKDLRGCQGCGGCRKEGAVACVQKDYFAPMYAELMEADGIVLGTPIYMGTITAQAYMLVQRLYPAAGDPPRFPDKNYIIALTQGNGDPKAYLPAVEGVKGFFSRLGWNQTGELVWAGGTEPPETLMSDAFAAGERLVK